MGYSLSWLAVKGKAPAAVREQLGLRETGKHEEIPESELTGAELPDGWYLIVSNQEERVASDDVVQQLSSGGEAATCFVEEHVMVSHAAGWKDGHRKWTVMHSSQKRRDHLETAGELPPAFSDILDRLLARQREADAAKRNVDFIFDIPIELARSIAGYRHDEDIPGQIGEPFAVLAGSRPRLGVASTPFGRRRQKWMALAGWQRGVLATFIVLAALAIIILGVTFVVMMFT